MAGLVRKKITYRYVVNLLLYGIGFLASAYLMQISTVIDSPLCQVFGRNCSQVVTSSYASYFGVPVASFALAYFTFQIVYLLITRVYGAATDKGVILIPFLMNIVSALISLYFLYILAHKLQEYCLFCLIVHTVNALTLLINLAIIRSQKSKHFYTTHTAVNISSFAIILIPFFISTTAFMAINYLKISDQLTAELQKTTNNLQYALFTYHQSEKINFMQTDTDIIIGGSLTASHEIIVFVKSGCKQCEKAQKRLTELVLENQTAFVLVVKDVKGFSRKQLDALSVEQTPAVFIDGQRADGWEIPGFLEFFLEDCDC